MRKNKEEKQNKLEMQNNYADVPSLQKYLNSECLNLKAFGAIFKSVGVRLCISFFVQSGTE